MKFYLVGGSVRDKLLGLRAKDNDYVVEAGSYDEMRSAIMDRGGKIFLETPQHFTIRAMVPKMGASDFVLPRIDGSYSDGRRPDSVIVGTLLDDLARRDFTVNAIAYDEDNDSYVDPHNGRADLEAKLLRCVGDTRQRFHEDALRLLRAVRFAITKGFYLHEDIKHCLRDPELTGRLRANVSEERKCDELHKCFAKDTRKTLKMLADYPLLADAVFHEDGRAWLLPTLKDA